MTVARIGDNDRAVGRGPTFCAGLRRAPSTTRPAPLSTYSARRWPPPASRPAEPLVPGVRTDPVRIDDLREAQGTEGNLVIFVPDLSG